MQKTPQNKNTNIHLCRFSPQPRPADSSANTPRSGTFQHHADKKDKLSSHINNICVSHSSNASTV